MNDLIDLHTRLKNRIEKKLDEANRLHAEIDTLMEVIGLTEDMLRHDGYKRVRDHWEKLEMKMKLGRFFILIA